MTPTIVPSYRSSADMRKQAEQLRTSDQKEVQRRWGDLARVADKSWLHATGKDGEAAGMEVRWVVSGAVMEITSVICNNPSCRFEWIVQYNPEAQRLDFISLPEHSLDKEGRVQQGGWILAVSEDLPVNDKWKYDPASNTLRVTEWNQEHVYKEVGREQLHAAFNVLRTASPSTNAARLANAAPASKPATGSGATQAAAKTAASGKASALEELPSAKIKPGSFGPFDDVIGSIYVADKLSLVMAGVTKEKDGTLTLSQKVLSTGRDYPPATWRIRPTSKAGVYEAVFASASSPSQGASKAALLSDGALRIQFDYLSEGAQYRHFNDWRITGSSLIKTVQNFRINADGTLVQSIPPTTETFARSTYADVQEKYQAAVALENNNRRVYEERLADRENDSVPASQRSFAEIFADTFQQQRRMSQEQEAKQQAFLNDLGRQARAIERERSRASSAREYSADVRPQQPARQLAQSAQAGGTATDDRPTGERGSAGVDTSASHSLPSAKKASNLIPTPEAITVCTRPSGANGSFECRNPVTVRNGNLSSPGNRTPEEMVMNSEACPAPRKLASTTHLVWGCGFGATNNGNSLDRSAGVDVKGRATYYCLEKEVSCRKTTP